MFHIVILMLGFVHWGNPRAGMPYDSQQGIPENVARVVVIFALLFFAYTAFRVRKALNDPSFKTRLKGKWKKNLITQNRP